MIRFPVWRELKHLYSLVWPTRPILLVIRFRVWRELKRWAGICNVGRSWPCDTLSRLKGIETWYGTASGVRVTSLVIRFPVWRELKHYSATTVRQPFWILVIRFRVWRELKLGLSFVGVCCPFRLVIRFRVWRELKLPKETVSPFSESVACDTLSRLKGIETCPLKKYRRFRKLLSLWYAFPFEGNWNDCNVACPYCKRSLWYAFPFEGNWNLCRQLN